MGSGRKDDKPTKKDPYGQREVREEIGEEIRNGSTTQPLVRNSNRDQARGDCDRTGDHHDEGWSRSDR